MFYYKSNDGFTGGPYKFKPEDWEKVE
jgi:hypothetical protein